MYFIKDKKSVLTILYSMREITFKKEINKGTYTKSR